MSDIPFFKNLNQHSTYSGGQKGRNDFVSNFTNKVVSSFLATTVVFDGNKTASISLLEVVPK